MYYIHAHLGHDKKVEGSGRRGQMRIILMLNKTFCQNN
jgi:hypothetical protein